MAVDGNFGAGDHDLCMSKTFVFSTWKHHRKPALFVLSGIIIALFNNTVASQITQSW